MRALFFNRALQKHFIFDIILFIKMYWRAYLRAVCNGCVMPVSHAISVKYYKIKGGKGNQSCHY